MYVYIYIYIYIIYLVLGFLSMQAQKIEGIAISQLRETTRTLPKTAQGHYIYQQGGDNRAQLVKQYT